MCIATTEDTIRISDIDVSFFSLFFSGGRRHVAKRASPSLIRQPSDYCKRSRFHGPAHS